MKKGQILSKNRELDRYLQSMSEEDPVSTNSKSSLNQNFSDLFIFNMKWLWLKLKEISVKLKSLMARNTLFIAFLYSAKFRQYLLSHSLTIEMKISPAEYLLQIIWFTFLVFLTKLIFPNSILGPLTMITIIILIIQLFVGLSFAYLFNSIADNCLVSANLTLVTLKLLHKLQISLLGRDLLHPLPPYFKYEEYLAQHSSPSLSIPSIRKSLNSSLSSLQKTVIDHSSSFRSPKFSYPQRHLLPSRKLKSEDNLSTSLTLISLQEISHQIFQLLLPDCLLSLWTTLATQLTTTSSVSSLFPLSSVSSCPVTTSPSSISSIFQTFSHLLLIYHSINNFRHDLASLTLPSLDPPPVVREGGEEKIDNEDILKQYQHLRKMIFSLRSKYEDDLNRLWLAENDLASLFPLLINQNTEASTILLKKSLNHLQFRDQSSEIEWKTVTKEELLDLYRLLEALYRSVVTPDENQPRGGLPLNEKRESIDQQDLLEQNECLQMGNEDQNERSRLAHLKHLFASEEEGKSTILDEDSCEKRGEDVKTIVIHTGRVLSQQEREEEERDRLNYERSNGELKQQSDSRELMMKELLPHVHLIKERVTEYEQEKWVEGREESRGLEEGGEVPPPLPPPPVLVPLRDSGSLLFATLLNHSLPLHNKQEEYTLGDLLESEEEEGIEK